MSMVRRTFLRRSAYAGGALAAAGPLGVLTARTAEGAPPPAAGGYGPLVPKGDLALPAEFNYQIVSHQGMPQRDGTPTPGIFDGMGAFPDSGGDPAGGGHRTVLIRNHENRRRTGEIPVAAPPSARYDPDPTYIAGCTRLVVERRHAGRDPSTGQQRYEYEMVDSFNILGGTDTNCAGGELPWKKWVTCEEVVNRGATGVKHGYVFEIDAMSDTPVPAVPVKQAGRFEHEAVAFSGGILYLTEDERIVSDPVLGYLGACFYRYVPDRRLGRSGALARVQRRAPGAQAPRRVPREHGQPARRRPVRSRVGDGRRARPRGRHERAARPRAGLHADARAGAGQGRRDVRPRGGHLGRRRRQQRRRGKVYFDCTEGGANNLGQIWEYDPGRETVTLIFQSPSAAVLENPDNITIVRQTQDVLVCEDSPGEQFIRGVTRDGEIYDFAQTTTNDTEFCGACFDPDGQTLYVNQQGDRLGANEPPEGSPELRAVTYAIYGPWEKRAGANNKNFGNGGG